MKKLFLSALLLAGTSALSFGQAVFTWHDMNPVIGDAFTSITCDTAGVMPGTGGANVTWDFSTLTTQHYDTAVAILYSTAPHHTMFPGSTIATKTLSITDTTLNFFIADTTKFAQNGYYHSATQNAVFTNSLDQLHYPMHYMDSFNDAYAGTIFVTYLGTPFAGNETGTAHTVIDGWGTLKLPGGVIDTAVLRVHTVQNFVDSAYIITSMVGAGFVINTYTWYMAGYHSALLTIAIMDQVSGPTTGTYVHNKTIAYAKIYPLSVAMVSNIANTLQLYPNPATNELNIQFDAVNTDKVSISLLDVTGRTIADISHAATSGVQLIKYNTSSLAKGVYMIRIASGSETITRKVVIE